MAADETVRRCEYCWSDRHTTEYCPKTWQGEINRAHLRCAYCGSHKHNVDGCPKVWPGQHPVVIRD